ncbi:MAG: DEAD/DEAH box helicase [Pseudomonadota bacterium]
MSFPATHPALSRALAEREYTTPTPVQKAVVETEAEGRDLLVSAQTGSGKTIAFGMAMADTLLEGADALGPAGDPLALIIAPTRELALQVQRELSWLYHYAGARIVSCVGGMDPGRERRELNDGAHIVVGTPGRLRDHLERRALRVTSLKAVVLDEADEMLDMGFREDLQFILETTPETRRTLLFSATLPKAIVTLATHYQKDALRIAARGETSGHADIEYRVVRIAGNKIERAVVNLLRFMDPAGALVFCNTRNAVRHMEAQLTERGFSCVALSGELSQSERNHALQALRDGRAKVCVATDVAARGIDLPSLSLVIHADLPNDAQVLQHRSGRTGRAGKKGVSVLLVPPSRRRKAEEMLGRARVTANWGNAPSADEIRKVDHERLLANPLLTETPSEDELVLADELLRSSDARVVAAAFVKMYRAGLPAPEDIEEDVPFQPRGEKHQREHKHREPREHSPRERTPREHAPREHKDHKPREYTPRPEGEKREYTPRSFDKPREERGSKPGGMEGGVWFRLNVGRERKADPKWLLPEICRQGEVTKKEIGAIRVFETETLFQVAPGAVEKFSELVTARKKGGVRILPARDQTGESHGRPYGERDAADKPSDAPPAPAREPRSDFHGKKKFDAKPVEGKKPDGGDKPFTGKKFAGKKFGDKKFGGKKFGKPGGGYKGKNPRTPSA